MLNIADVFTAAGLWTLGQVILIDLMLASDNVLVLGTLAAGLPDRDRKRVLAIGMVVALIALVGFALVATRLLKVVGLLFAGGLLLLWVAWKLFRELLDHRRHTAAHAGAEPPPSTRPKSVGRAVIQVALADLSMSLDNVLAVAGAARNYPAVLLFGLVLSVAVMAVAANLIARLIERYHWLSYIGLIVILYVAGSMIYQGWTDQQIGLNRLFG